MTKKPKTEGIPAVLNVNFMRIAEDLEVGCKLMSATRSMWIARKSEENARLYIFACGELRRCMTLAEQATREGVFIPASFAPDEVSLAE